MVSVVDGLIVGSNEAKLIHNTSHIGVECVADKNIEFFVNGVKEAKISSSGLEVVAGPLTVTAGGLTVTAGVGNFNAAGIRTIQAVSNVHDTTPTAAELTAAFGSPATLGRGFIGTVDDADADARGYLCFTSDASWYFLLFTKAA